jgi:hypothetical protein
MPAGPSNKRLKKNAPKGFIGSTPAEGPKPAPEPTGARAGNATEATK